MLSRHGSVCDLPKFARRRGHASAGKKAGGVTQRGTAGSPFSHIAPVAMPGKSDPSAGEASDKPDRTRSWAGLPNDHLVQIPNLDCNSALASHKGGTSLRSMSQSFSWAFLATLSAAPLIAPFALPIVFCTSPLAS
jgi:hypothetical protein